MRNFRGSALTIAAALILLVFGVIYLTRNSFMPYHSDAVSQKWADLQPATRYLILALMRATSGGFIAVAIAIIFLQVKFRVHRQSWIPYLILVMGTISMACSLYAIILVSTHTPGRPPVASDIGGEILLIAGFVANLKDLRKER